MLYAKFSDFLIVLLSCVSTSISLYTRLYTYMNSRIWHEYMQTFSVLSSPPLAAHLKSPLLNPRGGEMRAQSIVRVEKGYENEDIMVAR